MSTDAIAARQPQRGAQPAAAFDNTKARAALTARGFHMFPLNAGKKTPRVSGWNVPGASFDFNPDDNVAVFTGAFGDGALIVADIDVKNGKRGKETVEKLEAEGNPFPDTYTVATPSGGLHLYYRTAAAVQSGVDVLGPGVDIRSAGGYVVAPGSVIDGKPYVAQESPIADAPAWLIEACGKPREREPRKEVEPLAGYAAKVATTKARAYLQDEAPAAVQGAGGDFTTYATACRVRDFGVTQDEALDLMAEHWNERCSPPWPADELAKKIANAYAYASGQAGSDNPATIFEPVPRNDTASPTPRVSGGEDVAWRRPMFAIDLRNFESATPPPPRFMVDRIVPAGVVTLLGGHGGAGKSILALSIAAHFAAGQSVFGLPVEGGPALYVSLEDAQDWMLHRLRKVVDTFGLDTRAVTSNLRIADGTAAGALMREDGRWGASLSETAAMRELRELIGDASLIFIDNASDAFDGNENARGQVRTFMRTLANLGREDAAVVLIAHIDKNAARYGASGNSYSGSSAWHNSARSRLALTPATHGNDSVELRHEKSSRTAPIPTMRLTWSAGGVLVPAAAGGDHNADDADAVLAAIEAANRAGVPIPTARTGGYTAQAALSDLPDLPERLRGKSGRDRFWAAVATLRLAGKIRAEEYTTAARHQRERFVPTAALAA